MLKVQINLQFFLSFLNIFQKEKNAIQNLSFYFMQISITGKMVILEP